MSKRWMGSLAITLALSISTAAFAQAAKTAALDEGQKVEVREGDKWSAATIVKKEGRRYLIRYEGATEEEWVAGDRIRATGTNTPAAPLKPEAQKEAPKAPAIANWPNGANVQVKWGGLWSDASIVNRRGEWYLIEYQRGGREWVEHWRIRKAGSTEDDIGYAKPNPRWKVGDNPPREKAGEPPEPIGGGGRKERAEIKAEFSNDPAFKEADPDAAKDIDLHANGGMLKLTPDPAAPAANVRPIKPAGASKEFFETMKDLVISRDGKFAAVIHLNAPPGQEAQLKLERFDLAAGKSAGVFPLPTNMVLLDISPDGKLVALRNDVFGFGKSSRLEVWAIDGTAIKKVCILFPYEKQPTGPDRDISGAWLPDTATVITTNSKGRLVLWDMSTGKATYRAQITPGSKPAFSGGGKQMAIEAEKSVVILEPSSGKVLGSLPLEDASGLSFSFSPSGRQLAGWGFQNVYAWDLTSGEKFRDFSIAAGSGEFAMVADGYAMVDHSILIDFERRIPLWDYQAGGRSSGAVAPSGMLWYSVKGGGQDEHGALTPLKLPTADALALSKQLKPDDLLLLKPGVHVALAINIDAPDADRQDILKSYKDQLEQKKLVIDDAAPIRITASNEPGKTTEVEYRGMGPGAFGQTQKVSVTPMITKLVVEVDGKNAWQKASISGAGFFLTLKQGQTIEQAVAEASKVNIPFLKNMTLPVYLTKPHEPAWYGSSKLP
jgi:hypothetical protein